VAGEFARAMADKAREGIEVRVLLDDWGSHPGRLADLMEKAGVKLRWYKPLRIYSIYKLGNRTHRKILTVDGRLGFIGGFGIDDRWKGDARNPDEWRETNVQLEGPVVAQLQAIFMEDWVHTTGEVLHGEKQFPPTPAAGTMLAQAIAASRSDASSRAKLLYYMAIQAARKTIWIENAYFVPDGQIRRGLVNAVARGVDVRVLVPGRHIDVPIVRMASRFHYGELLDGGVKIYEYRPTMMHNKVMVVDGIWSTIGSINFVNRSMKKNAEANVAIYDRGFAALVENMIIADLEKSEVFTRAKWKKRGLLARLGETVFWLFSENY
jgi:cardiolipin synthase